MYRQFWDLFINEYKRIPIVLMIWVITITMSFLEGINIGLLIPLLEAMSSEESTTSHWISRYVEMAFTQLGIPFKLSTILLVLGSLFLVMSGLKYLVLMMVAGVQRDFTVWMRSRYMRYLLRADISYFHNERLGVLTDSLTTQSDHAGASLFAFTELFTIVVLAAIYLISAFIIAPVLTTIALVMMILVSLSLQVYISRGKQIGRDGVAAANNLQATAVEILSGVQVVKSFLMEGFFWGSFTKRADEVGRVFYRRERNVNRLLVFQEVALLGLIGLIVYLGIGIFRMEISVIVVLLFVLYRLAPKVSSLNKTRQALSMQLAALQSVRVITEESTSPKVLDGAHSFKHIDTAIDIKEAFFSYGNDNPVLKGTSFSIAKGETTAIIGSSGAGKSTIVDLVLRFYDLDSGVIEVDGIDIKNLKLEDWRSGIGVVSQDVFLFNDTVYNNIILGREGITKEGVEYSAKRAYAHDFINALPDGYHTIIGDRGLNLSGGQRQRISLARAIVGDPDILILDEATSSLDSESELLIHRYMESISGERTLIVIAHRMSTIQKADKIVVLQDGKIVEEGNWEDLMAKSGVLANYHTIQLGE